MTQLNLFEDVPEPKRITSEKTRKPKKWTDMDSSDIPDPNTELVDGEQVRGEWFQLVDRAEVSE